MPDIDAAEAKQFLDLLLEGWHEENHVLIWKLQGKESMWGKSSDELLHAIDITLKPSSDLFVGVGLSPENFGPDRRCPADKTAGLLGFVADIDIRHSVHAQEALPASQEAALELLKAMPLASTLVTHSGHGLQAWWCFNEPWIFDDDEERKQAQQLAADWGATIREIAQRRNYSLDSTHDLARVMRLPGTINNKDEPVPVRLLKTDGPRWNPPYDFEEVVLVAGAIIKPATKKSPHFQLLANAEPPAGKLTALLANHPKFADSWNHTREDLRDTSPSGYDLSLASIAALAEWEPQEIINLLLAHRRNYKADLKLDRHDYYQHTLDTAFAPLKRRVVAAKPKIETEEERVRAIKDVGRELNINLLEIEHIEGERPLLRFHIIKLEHLIKVELDATRVKHSEVYVQKMIYGHTGEDVCVVGEKLNSNEWKDMAQFFYTIAKKITMEEDGTADGAAISTINDFLKYRPPHEIPKGEAIQDPESPFIRDERIWISAPELRKYAATIHGIRSSTREWIQRMKLLGAKSKAFAYETIDEGKRTTTNLWGVPDGVVRHADYGPARRLIDEVEADASI